MAEDGRASTKRSASPLSQPTDGGYPLSGPSDLPDPVTHAYRDDLADVALAGRVIASHYAEPLSRRLTVDAAFLVAEDVDSECLATLSAGDEMQLLEIGRGWAWGYGPDGRVGYVRASAFEG